MLALGLSPSLASQSALVHTRSLVSVRPPGWRTAPALFQSRQEHGEAAATHPRPTITKLLKCFDRLPENPLPAPLVVKLRDYASKEQSDSVLRNMPLPSLETAAYEEGLKLEVANHINTFFRSQMDGKSTSEAVYSPQTLDLYDAYVWGFNSPYLWRILQEECQELYDEKVRDHHLDIAVGTGLLLKNLDWGSAGARQRQALTLVDLNANSLEACAFRVEEAAESKGQSLEVEKIIADITDTDAIPEQMRGRYESVSANFLFHCLHGDSMLAKRSAFESCASLLNAEGGGYFFGSTILGKDLLDDGEHAGEAATQTLMDYNKWGIFGNTGDTFDDLEHVLNETFEEVNVWRSGYCGVWKVRKPIQGDTSK